jgi:PAS domain S-box-containing protein
MAQAAYPWCMAADFKRLKDRLVAARADVEGRPSAQELEVALEEIQALWDELGAQADHLAHERERHAALFEHAPFACLVTDVHGNVRDANSAAVALLEVPATYLLGKPLAIFVADAEREAFRVRLATVVRAPERLLASWLTQLKSADGKPRDVKVDLRALPSDEKFALPLLWFFRDFE